jgi:hypothetical protein
VYPVHREGFRYMLSDGAVKGRVASQGAKPCTKLSESLRPRRAALEPEDSQARIRRLITGVLTLPRCMLTLLRCVLTLLRCMLTLLRHAQPATGGRGQRPQRAQRLAAPRRHQRVEAAQPGWARYAPKPVSIQGGGKCGAASAHRFLVSSLLCWRLRQLGLAPCGLSFLVVGWCCFSSSGFSPVETEFRAEGCDAADPTDAVLALKLDLTCISLEAFEALFPVDVEAAASVSVVGPWGAQRASPLPASPSASPPRSTGGSLSASPSRPAAKLNEQQRRSVMELVRVRIKPPSAERVRAHLRTPAPPA